MGEKSSPKSSVTNDVVLSAEPQNLSVEHLIDQLQQRTADLEAANRELRRISHYSSLFLARMSHELRTPLTAILGFSEILLDQEQLTDTQRRFCQKIQDSGIQLQNSLDRLVDLSRLEAGQTEVFLQEFSLRETLRESCRAVARLAKRQQVRVEYDLAPEVSAVVSDQGKLRQALNNFLAWAVSRNGVGQEIEMYAEQPAPGYLRIRIDDDGEPLADPNTVFEPHELSGTQDVDGLGLIIGRRLIDLMKGSVRVENREGGGLRMQIELPTGSTKGCADEHG